MWKHPKKRGDMPKRVISDLPTQQQVIKDLHQSLWAGHRGVWATFSKIKDRYWWKGMYKDIAKFVETCLVFQQFSNVRHRDGLHPTYPLSIHFKWVVDLVVMPVGVWKMRYIVLAREDLTNQVEGIALHTKATKSMSKFFLK